MLAVLLLHSDDQGHPNRNGGALHFCVLSDEGPPPAVNQMMLRDKYPNFDCAVAVAESCGRMRGKPIPGDMVIETDEANTGHGATIAGLISGLDDCHLAAHAEHRTPGRGWVMNPAWGGVIPPASSQPYLDAAAVGWPDGWLVVVDTVQQSGNPTPTPTGTPVSQQGDPEMSVKQYNHAGGHHVAACDGAGLLTDRVLTATGWQHADVQAGCRPFSPIEAVDMDGVQNLWAFGTQGDLMHFSCDPKSGVWSRDPHP